MEVSTEKLEGNKVELKVEIEAERVNKALNQAYKKVVKEVSLPGFRKGKVPRHVLEAKYGIEVLYKDALDILIPQGYDEAVKAAEIEPIAQPDIDDYHIAKGEATTFTAIVEVKPEVKLGEYKGLGVEKEEIEVKDEEIEAELSSLQQKHSQLIYTDKETVEEGDFVIIDYEGRVDGETFPGGSAEEYSLEIGSGTFIPGFEDKLIGAKVGEELEIELTFPEEYHASDLAGKETIFTVNVKEIKEKVLPELNDDFAKESSDFETLAELKEDIKEKVRKRHKEVVEEEFTNNIIEKAATNAEVDISEILINSELDKAFQNMEYNISSQGLNVDDYLQYMGMDKDSWREQNYKMAEKRARNNIVLEAIAEKEDIKASDEEIDEQVEKIAKDTEQDLDKVKAILQMQGQLNQLSHEIMMEKAVDFLVENN